ncbi:Spy/CpxP family protein refolding chaperone [Thermodesulfovibrio sp. TK110]
MKKTFIIALVALFAVAIIGGAAYAWRGAGAGYGCPGYTALDPEKTQRFYNDTASLRQKMLQLRGELAQLYAQPSPDWNAIGKKQQEMVQLRTEMQKKAQEYGLPYYGMGMKRFCRGW